MSNESLGMYVSQNLNQKIHKPYHTIQSPRATQVKGFLSGIVVTEMEGVSLHIMKTCRIDFY